MTASTPAEKRAVIERIHAAWLLRPGMSLGALIEKACANRYLRCTQDTTLAELCETFVKEHSR